MSFRHTNFVVCETAEEMNKHLAYVHQYRRCYEGDYDVKEKRYTLSTINAFYSDKLVRFLLTYKIGKKKAATYVFSKSGGELKNEEYALEAWTNLNQYYKVPALDMRVWQSMSASPYRFTDRKWSGKRVKAWSYDVNSAYAAAMLRDMPDTS